ncbi:MAG: hypothetical protein H5T47_05210 [Archaeoglobi archaeon]|nr:hypothetical protein [Candidatus Mnemosynella bozhongmuii]
MLRIQYDFRSFDEVIKHLIEFHESWRDFIEEATKVLEIQNELEKKSE